MNLGKISSCRHSKTRFHPTNPLILIDSEIHELVTGLYQKGIIIQDCCQDCGPRDYIWLLFSSPNDLQKFVDLINPYLPLFNDMYENLIGTGDQRWITKTVVFNPDRHYFPADKCRPKIVIYPEVLFSKTDGKILTQIFNEKVVVQDIQTKEQKKRKTLAKSVSVPLQKE